MKRTFVVAIATILLSTTTLPAQAKKDEKVLQGTWNVISATDEGRAKKEADQVKLTFKGNFISLKTPRGSEPNVTFTLDPSKKPKWINIQVKKDRVLKGIYEIKGNKLKICFNERKAGERPTEFVSTRDTDYTLIIMRQAKKK